MIDFVLIGQTGVKRAYRQWYRNTAGTRNTRLNKPLLISWENDTDTLLVE